MSHAVGDRGRCCAVVLALVALMPVSRACAEPMSGNPRFWATPERFQGIGPVDGGRTDRVTTRSASSTRTFGMPHSISQGGSRAVGVRAGGVKYTLLSETLESPAPEPSVAWDESANYDEQMSELRVITEEGSVVEDGLMPGDTMYGNEIAGDDVALGVVELSGDGCQCGLANCGVCRGCDPRPGFAFLTLCHTTISLGVTGFKNASNLASDGSFGFHEGLNYASPLPVVPETGLGWQVGFRSVQSNLSGASFTLAERRQTFFTTGLFRRAPFGLQGGVVFDLLRDAWYDDTNLSQIRGEISWKCPARHEWGYWFAVGDGRDTTRSPLPAGGLLTWEPTDIHAFFYRRRFACLPSAEGRFYVGFSEQADGLLGADATVPINDRWGLRSSFTYLVPDQPTNAGGTQNEGWNLALAGVWHFGANAQVRSDPYAPLFEVADNGTFFVDQVGL